MEHNTLMVIKSDIKWEKEEKGSKITETNRKGLQILSSFETCLCPSYVGGGRFAPYCRTQSKGTDGIP